MCICFCSYYNVLIIYENTTDAFRVRIKIYLFVYELLPLNTYNVNLSLLTAIMPKVQKIASVKSLISNTVFVIVDGECTAI